MRRRLRALALTLASFGGAAELSAQGRIVARAPLEVLERLDGLRRALERWHPDLEVAWIAHGASPDFSGLFDGSVDLVVSSRSISPWERALAGRLELELDERVLALDNVAVVVHPQNPIPSLTMEQLGALYRGGIVGWYGFGGSDFDVRLLVPPIPSGEFQVLMERVLSDGSELSPHAEVVDDSDGALVIVASDRRAVALLPGSADRSRVRTVPIGPDERGEDPLRRSLWLYTRGAPDEPLRRLVSCLLSGEAQTELANAGFTALPGEGSLLRRLASRSRPGGASVTRVTFPFGESALDEAAQRALSDLTERAPGAGASVWITGHADAREDGPRRRGGVSEARARAVADFLEARGVAVAGAEGVGAIEPGGGAFDSRRADVWWLPRR